jgi:signal transduction histidine kinase/ActR/RegA family two-component response regulator
LNEVSHQATALLLDSLEQRGIDAFKLWHGLGVTRESLTRRIARVDWTTWIALLDRVERGVPIPMEEMFVTGAAERTGHPFARIANVLLSQRDLYGLVARWGMRRTFLCVRAQLEVTDSTNLHLVLHVDDGYAGSLAFYRFSVGVFRELPRLQGYERAKVTLLPGATPQRAEYAIVLPKERTLVARVRRLVGAVSGGMATLDELEAQADEIAHKNSELQQQLARSRDRDRWLDVALLSGNIGLWRWDPSTRRVRVSPILAGWLRVPGQTDIDTSVWGRIVHEDDQDHIAKVMATSLENKTPFEAEYRIEHDGQIRWFHIKGRVETEPDGRVYAYGSTADITDAKLMDQRLRMADRLISAGTLAAGIAHEINNPLTYVMGSIDLLRRRLAQHPAARDATADLVAQMLDGVERIRSVVADVRAFARADDQAIVAIDLRAVVAAAIRIVSSDVRHRAELTSDLAPDTPPVLANDARLGQVLINLLVNASQAMPPDRDVTQNRIVVRTRRLSSGDAALIVEDNGTGIPPEIVPRVFDPFFTTKPVGVGTGLGLSVVQGIVASLGGRIELDSTVGRGSTFMVTLRAADEQAAAAATPETGLHATVPGRVLVIDDEPMIRNVVVRTLAAQGFVVEEACNGRDGLARAIGTTRYDAILCDLMMPDLDGVTLHSELLAHRPELARRVVFISGGAVTPRTQAFLEQPGVVVLHKPFAIDRLLEAIVHAAGQGTSTSLPLT